MGTRLTLGAGLVVLLALPADGQAADETPKQILIKNVNVWDGTSDALAKADVLIEGKLIKAVGSGANSICS